MSLTQPMKTYRLTWDELMSRRSEIAPNAVLEVKVYPPEAPSQVNNENQALISLLQSWREENATQDAQQRERTLLDLLRNCPRIEIRVFCKAIVTPIKPPPSRT